MNILIYSYFEPQKDLIAGGAQQVMYTILRGILDDGNHVSYLCPRYRYDSVLTHKNLSIFPILTSHEGPRLYPYEQFQNGQNVEKLQHQADVVWSIDRVPPFPLIKPFILTLDTLAYPLEIQALMSLTWDVLLLSSNYLNRVVEPIVGKSCWENSPPPIDVIPYGVDTNIYKRVDPTKMIQKLGLDGKKRYLLFPHRPDPNKGFDIALQALSKLLKVQPDFYLLIPQNLTYKSDIRFYNILHQKAKNLGIEDHVIFHEWIRSSDMPAYFSLGTATLVPGTFPEGFGLIAVQSIACGTPVVCSKAGALGELFPPDHGVDYVDFGDVGSIVAAILNPLKLNSLQTGLEYIQQKYNIDRLIQSHLYWFREARKKQSLYTTLGVPLQISPWCRIEDRKVVWHDFKQKSVKLNCREWEIIQMIQDQNLDNLNNDPEIMELLLRKGIIVGYNSF